MHPTIFLGKTLKLEKYRSVTPIGSKIYGLKKPEYFQSKFDCDIRFSICVIAMKLECHDLSRR
jgi:hypothetical protein